MIMKKYTSNNISERLTGRKPVRNEVTSERGFCRIISVGRATAKGYWYYPQYPILFVWYEERDLFLHHNIRCFEWLSFYFRFLFINCQDAPHLLFTSLTSLSQCLNFQRTEQRQYFGNSIILKDFTS